MLFFLLEYYQWSAIELSDDHDPGLVPSVIPSSTLHFLPVLLVRINQCNDYLSEQ